MGSYWKMRLAMLFVIFFGLGLFFTITGSIDNAKAGKADMDFNYMRKSDFTNGMFVKGRVYEIYDEYAYEESYEESFGVKKNKRVSSHYYVVPMVGSYDTGTPMYVTLEVKHVKMIKEAELLMQQTWDYMDYGTEPAVWNEFDIVGEVSALEPELSDYLYEWFMYGDDTITRADVEPYICPYKITYYSIESHSTTVIVTAVMAVIGAIGCTVMIMLYLKNRNNNIPSSTATYEAVPMGREYNPAQDSFNSYGNNGSFPPPSPNTSQSGGEMGYAEPVKSSDLYAETKSYSSEGESTADDYNNDNEIR